MPSIDVELWAGGADLAALRAIRINPHIRGFTTISTLMRLKDAVDYAATSRAILEAAGDLPDVGACLVADDAAVLVEALEQIHGDSVFAAELGFSGRELARSQCCWRAGSVADRSYSRMKGLEDEEPLVRDRDRRLAPLSDPTLTSRASGEVPAPQATDKPLFQDHCRE